MPVMLKRLFTAMGCFVVGVLPIIFFVFIVGAMYVGAKAGMQDPANASIAGETAGEEFGRTQIGACALWGFFITFILSTIVGFTPLFPWCKKPKEPVQPYQPQHPTPPPLGG